jgi:hypothetical protein
MHTESVSRAGTPRYPRRGGKGHGLEIIVNATGGASLCLIMGAVSAPLAAERQSEGYASLRGVTDVKSVLDFRIADPKSAALLVGQGRAPLTNKLNN